MRPGPTSSPTAPAEAPPGGRAGVRGWVAVVAAALALRGLLAVTTDVYADEAYYWAWAQRLDWSYYDHPPLVAWLIRALGVRPLALACGVASVAGVGVLAAQVHGSREAGWRAAALWAVLPAGMLTGFLALPDAPLLALWPLALLALWRERWVWAGVLCGLALLAKYHGVVLGLAFLAACVQARRLPRGAWLTAGLGLALFAPVLAWNAARDWVGFGFQLRHGLGGRGGLPSLLEFLGGQAAMTGGALLVAGVAYAVRGPREQRLLRAAVWVPLALFALAALRTRGEANWPVPAYVAACAGLAGWRPGWARALVGASAAVVLALTVHLVWSPLALERDVPNARLHGFGVLAALRAHAPAAVYAPSYQLASQVWLHTGLPVTTAGPARFSQYDLWPRPHVPAGADALWVSECQPPPEALAARFEGVERLPELAGTWRGRDWHRFCVWRLRGSTGS